MKLSTFISIRSLLLATALLGFALPKAGATAVLANFDDLNVGSGNGGVLVPANYGGLNWTNFDAYSISHHPQAFDTGPNYGVVSGQNAVRNGDGTTGGTPATISLASADVGYYSFSLSSFYMAHAKVGSLYIRIWGFTTDLSGVTRRTYATTVDLTNVSTPTLFTYGWTDLSSVTFTPVDSNGNVLTSFSTATEFTADDISLVTQTPITNVPEPSTWAALGAAISGLVFLRRSRRSGTAAAPVL